MAFISKDDLSFMATAFSYAKTAFNMGEIPVGAVVVKDNKIIGFGYNTREGSNSPLGHGEINAINMASQTLGDWRLTNCTIYVTLEPCPMCCGAIINSRIKRLVYGAKDDKWGCAGSVCDLSAMTFPHTLNITSGIMALECSNLLEQFFKQLRDNK